MSSRYVSKALRRKIASQARNRCGYCLVSQQIIGPLLEIDHLMPVALGGTSEEANLWLACPLCNGAKSDLSYALDPLTKQTVSLFNPRQDRWQTHFQWIDDGAVLEGLTPIGRATVAALNMNQPDIVTTRKLWVSVGWHPPKD